MKLSTVRKGHKMTQADLGKVVGVSQRAISSYEAGKRRPSPEIATRIAVALGMTINEMWESIYMTRDESRC